MVSCSKLVVMMSLSDYFTLYDLIADKYTVQPGQTVYLSVNDHSSIEAGLAKIYLLIDGTRKVGERPLNIHAGHHSHNLVWTPQLGDAGQKTVTACVEKDGEVVRSNTITIEVEAPSPSFTTSISISPQTVKVGQPVTITGVVTNVGNGPGVPSMYLEKDGVEMEGTAVMPSVPLRPGASFRHRWTYTPTEDEAGKEIVFCVKPRPAPTELGPAPTPPSNSDVSQITINKRQWYQYGPYKIAVNCGESYDYAMVQLIKDGYMYSYANVEKGVWYSLGIDGIKIRIDACPGPLDTGKVTLSVIAPLA